jgi:hypothetical protein
MFAFSRFIGVVCVVLYARHRKWLVSRNDVHRYQCLGPLSVGRNYPARGFV